MRNLPPPTTVTAVQFTLFESAEMFQHLQQEVVDVLAYFPNALAKLKQVLASLVLPIGKGKAGPLVDPLFYMNAQTTQELFRLVAPYWNFVSTDLFALLVEMSGCSQAANKVVEFLEAKASKSSLVLCIRQVTTYVSGENDQHVTDFETTHKSPLCELQSLHPILFAQPPPEHKITFAQAAVRISVEVNNSLVCISDYEEITKALSGFLQVPKAALVYVGCSNAPLVLCWLVTHVCVPYMRSRVSGLSGHRLLAESNVTRIAIGDHTYKCPTIKVIEPGLNMLNVYCGGYR